MLCLIRCKTLILISSLNYNYNLHLCDKIQYHHHTMYVVLVSNLQSVVYFNFSPNKNTLSKYLILVSALEFLIGAI